MVTETAMFPRVIALLQRGIEPPMKEAVGDIGFKWMPAQDIIHMINDTPMIIIQGTHISIIIQVDNHPPLHGGEGTPS